MRIKVYLGSTNGHFTVDGIKSVIEEEDLPKFLCYTNEDGLDELLSMLEVGSTNKIVKTEFCEAIEEVMKATYLSTDIKTGKILDIYHYNKSGWVPCYLVICNYSNFQEELT